MLQQMIQQKAYLQDIAIEPESFTDAATDASKQNVKQILHLCNP
jgi:hypothetical protein